MRDLLQQAKDPRDPDDFACVVPADLQDTALRVTEIRLMERTRDPQPPSYRSLALARAEWTTSTIVTVLADSSTK